MAVHHFLGSLKRRDLAGTLECPDEVVHHELSIGHCEVLRPMDGLQIIVEVVGSLGEIGQILVRKVDHPCAHVFLRQFDEIGPDPIPHAS